VAPDGEPRRAALPDGEPRWAAPPDGEPRRAAVPDNEPLRAALAAGSPDAVREAILGGTLIVALTPDTGDPRTPLAVMPAGDGTLTALAFSGPGTLGAWGGTDRVAHGSGRAMAALIRDQGVTAAALDIAGPVAAALDHADLRALASGVSDPGEPEPVGEGRAKPLRLRAPDPPLPAEARAALAAALQPHPAVAAAYVFEGPPDDGTRRLWLGLDIPPPRETATAEAALQAGLAALRAHLPGVRLEFTIVERDAVLASLAEAAPPVYER
jgi:hypothetical protein